MRKKLTYFRDLGKGPAIFIGQRASELYANLHIIQIQCHSEAALTGGPEGYLFAMISAPLECQTTFE